MVKPDGIVKNPWGLDIGHWESKDEKDDIEAEIDAKIKKGYPLTNILFEDSNTAILFQRGEEVQRAPVRDAEKLHLLITNFFEFKSDVVYKFEDAIEKFKADIPIIVETLRKKIITTREKNPKFIEAQNTFLELCKTEINPAITIEDIREMMIQHILTSDIFNKVFNDADFHRHNTIASELEKLTETLFSYTERRNLISSIEHYYEAINAAASAITDHHEKQKFLKVLYENFYKVYNPKAADRLGVVYTPNEIVQFMVKSTDHLLYKHFGRVMADKNVEILDPATGTGTFICEVIEHAIPKQHLDYKFKNEIHANEVAILPYYIANLNIEYTFKQKMEYYAEYPNLCFVDTLDNVFGLETGMGEKIEKYKTSGNLFAISSENSERIKRQNKKKISVIIGNPPYNANQLNENENNKNREYPFIDKRIKDTYIKHSTAQKTKVYDMYARFYRWAMDRVDKNGIIAMITNRSFIDSRTFDGFRKCVQAEFSHCYIVDTKSDVRANPKIAGTTHNVFGIQTGVAIMFLIKKEKHEGNCHIEYVTMDDFWRKEEKLDWLKNNPIENIHFESIRPDKNNNWINLAEDSDWDELLPVCSKDVKGGNSKKALFNLFSNGIVTARDEWSYDYNNELLSEKVKFFCNVFTEEQKRWQKSGKSIKINDFINRSIKFGSEIEEHLSKWHKLNYEKEKIILSEFRPFNKRYFYFSDIYTHRAYQLENYFGNKGVLPNLVISFLSMASSHELYCFAIDKIFDAGILKQGNGITSSISLFRYDKSTGQRHDNITDWGLQQFQEHYGAETLTGFQTLSKLNPKLNPGSLSEKEAIFYYVYAVLHNPAYRKKYELNLKREFPRIPFYPDFNKWAAWGMALMDLHINYETVSPFPLLIKEGPGVFKGKPATQKEIFAQAKEPEAMFKRQPKVKPKLKADKEAGIIEIDELTFLSGIPKEAWEYKLGNRSALEWVLDQYKESKPKDPTIAEKFNTYKFADYKPQVIDLLKRVCTVSVETMKIVQQMG
jgi:predicted helicase